MTRRRNVVGRWADLLPEGVETLYVLRCPVCRGAGGSVVLDTWYRCSFCDGQGATAGWMARDGSAPTGEPAAASPDPL